MASIKIQNEVAEGFVDRDVARAPFAASIDPSGRRLRSVAFLMDQNVEASDGIFARDGQG